MKMLKLWSELIAFYVERIKLSNNHKEHKKYWFTIADIYAGPLNNLIQASMALEQALKLDSKNSKLRLALVEIYTKTGKNNKR